MLGSDFLLPLDGAGFSLRLCPDCGTEFKVRATPRDGPALASALAAHLPQMDRGELGSDLGIRHCPYCRADEPADAWWTAGQRRWIERQAHRLADEIRWRWMQLPFERLGQNPRPTYVSFAPAAVPSPLAEESREHLVAFPLPCCGEELLVSDRWSAAIRCHYCGFVHARDTVGDVGLELAQLRAWHDRIRSP